MACILACATSCGVRAPLEPHHPVVAHANMENPFVRGLQDGWVANSYGVNKVEVADETSDIHSGRHAQRITCTDFTDGGAQIYRGGIRVEAGKPYTIELWLKGDVSSPVFVGLRRHEAPYTRYLARFVHVTPTWRRFLITGTAVDTDSNAGLYIMFQHRGTLLVDDIIVSRGNPAPSPRLEKGNRVYNGGFDVGLAGWTSTDALSWTGTSVLVHTAIESQPFSIRTGQPVTLSAQLKATRAGTRAKLEIFEWADEGRDEPELRDSKSLEVELSGTRQRYVISGRLFPRWWSSYVVRVTAGAPFELDDVQVEEGAATEFRPRDPIEVAATTTARVIAVGDPVVISSRTTRPARLVFTLYDARGRKLAEQARDANAQDQVTFRPRAPGAYRASVVVVGGRAHAETSFAVTPDVPPSDQFGVHLVREATAIDLAKRLGFGLVRLHDFGTNYCDWNRVEPKPGAFVWFDSEIDDLRRDGFALIGVLGHPPAWARQRDPAAWERYVTETARHYAGRIGIWEIWNEPYDKAFFDGTPAEYAQLVTIAARAIKRVDPRAFVLAGATNPQFETWSRAVISSGALEDVDGIAMHAYWSYDDIDHTEPALATSLHRLRELMRGANRELPVFVTEAGVRSPPLAATVSPREGIHDTPVEAASALVRGNVELLSAGASHVIGYYIGRARGWYSRMANGAYVLTDVEGRPKPTLLAYSVLAAQLSGATPIEVIRSPDRVVHVFDAGRDAVAVIWGTHVAMPPDLDCVDMFGAAAKAPLGSGEPLYCRAHANSGRELASRLRRE
jgi:hypothetical protein